MVESTSYLNLRERLLLRSEGFARLPSTEKLCLASSISGGDPPTKVLSIPPPNLRSSSSLSDTFCRNTTHHPGIFQADAWILFSAKVRLYPK